VDEDGGEVMRRKRAMRLCCGGGRGKGGG